MSLILLKSQILQRT